MDFFAVSDSDFKLLYCFFVIEHGRRRILHFNVTTRPTSEWVVQQLRKAFPESGQYRYAIFERDAKFNEGVIAFLKATSLSRSAPVFKRLGKMERPSGGSGVVGASFATM
jgi:hypothetical protein